MGERLFRIADAFSIQGRGVVVVGDWAEMARLWVGDPIMIARADGSRLRTTVGGIESFTPNRRPNSFAILLGPEVARDDDAPGNEIVREGPTGA